MNTLAQRLRCTEGQFYTAVIGLAAAVLLMAIGLPPVLRGNSLLPIPAAAENQTAAATTSTAPTGQSAPTSTTPPIEPVVTGSTEPAAPNLVTPATTTTTTASSSAPSIVTDKEASPGSNDGTLSIIDSGYTSSTAGTPLAGPEVPEDGMPVGVRLGRVDKASYARLAGTGRMLRLRLVSDPAANQLVSLAAVRACVITEAGWVLPTPGAPPDEAPDHDPTRCVEATSEQDGVWTVDLAPLGDFDPLAGIALLPLYEAPSTFQVTFSTVARGTAG